MEEHTLRKKAAPLRHLIRRQADNLSIFRLAIKILKCVLITFFLRSYTNTKPARSVCNLTGLLSYAMHGFSYTMFGNHVKCITWNIFFCLYLNLF